MYLHAMTRVDPASIDAIATLCACRNVRRAARAVTGLYDRILAPSGQDAVRRDLKQLTALAGENLATE